MTKELLEKYLNNNCTAQEVEQIFLWMRQQNFRSESRKLTRIDWLQFRHENSLVTDQNLDTLTGEDKSLAREEMFWEFRQEQAARVGNHKWIQSERRENNNGFFDLSEDIGEKNDLSSQRVKELSMVKEKFYQWQKETMVDAEPRGPFKNF